MVGHQSFSVHIAQMAELSCVCADIMSRHCQRTEITIAKHCGCLQPQHTVHSTYMTNHSQVWWSESVASCKVH